MTTQLQTGRVRLVISGTDRRLASAVLERFLEWWDASGHRDLVVPVNIEPRPDVSATANTAVVTLPVHFSVPIGFEAAHSTSVDGPQLDPTGGFVEFHALARRSHVGGSGGDWIFEVVDDVPDTESMFPSEATSRRALDGFRRWRPRRGAITRASPQVVSGFRRVAGRRPFVRAAAVSVVLALAIAASVARPTRIATVMPDTYRTAPGRLPARPLTTNETATGPATVVKAMENPVVPSQSLAMFAAPSDVAPRRIASAYLRTARTAAPKTEPPAPSHAGSETGPTPGKSPPPDIEYVGTLVVVSEPSGAAVRIDGRNAGTTPLQLDGIRVGSHAIQLLLDGYPIWSTAATVVYGKSNDVLARLAR